MKTRYSKSQLRSFLPWWCRYAGVLTGATTCLACVEFSVMGNLLGYLGFIVPGFFFSMWEYSQGLIDGVELSYKLEDEEDGE